MLVDTECYKLAVYFAPDNGSERQVMALAQHIQDAIEDWFRAEGDGAPPPTSPLHRSALE